MKKLALHWKILIGMALGIAAGFTAAIFDEAGRDFVTNWVKPFGTIFINLLKVIALPLIVSALITGIADLKDLSKFSTMGGRTVAAYLITTVIAVTIGLLAVNIIQPGKLITPETSESLQEQFKVGAEEKIALAEQQKGKGPLAPVVDIVPSNIFAAGSDNGNMLQVIFFVILFSIALLMIPEGQAEPVKSFFKGLYHVTLKVIDMIMAVAPIGVFALMAAVVVEAPEPGLFTALLGYGLTVLAGLAAMVFIVYPLAVKFFAGRDYPFFLKGIAPAQLVAFSTSSSAATLPVTMERVRDYLGVDEDVSSFVLPIGATVNMDGTSCYQAVAAVFIAQVLGFDLSLTTQLMIILTATLASIGSAAVPSAGMVMLVVVLGQAGIPEAGLALIFALDRPLDMCRTTVNVTGDAAVSMIIAKSVDKLHDPEELPALRGETVEGSNAEAVQGQSAN